MAELKGVNKQFFETSWDKQHPKLIELSAQVDLTAQNPAGLTPLHAAARLGLLEVARILLDRGADLYSRDNYIKTPLHVAATFDQCDMMDLLLSAGTSIDVKDKYGFTPLHWAAQWNKVAACRFLLERGANLRATDVDGNMPLHRAAYNGHIESSRVLLAAGARSTDLPGPPATKNHSAFQQAVGRDNQALVRFYVEEMGEDLGQRTAAGATLLQLAGKSAEMKALLLSLKSQAAINGAVIEKSVKQAIPSEAGVAPPRKASPGWL